jgi:hypothetical protein
MPVTPFPEMFNGNMKAPVWSHTTAFGLTFGGDLSTITFSRAPVGPMESPFFC